MHEADGKLTLVLAHIAQALNKQTRTKVCDLGKGEQGSGCPTGYPDISVGANRGDSSPCLLT